MGINSNYPTRRMGRWKLLIKPNLVEKITSPVVFVEFFVGNKETTILVEGDVFRVATLVRVRSIEPSVHVVRMNARHN